ncbi:MAG: hypothetical protein M3Z22_03630, partial [Verrucomicrobiota bacterium]|nr:hypothetical protein [Verrucomicrobiota bacterium]
HTGAEMAAGFVAPVTLLFVLSTRARVLLRAMKWELGLLLIVLIISMLPSANVFRWSFRWLPFFHLILALAAAEALQSAGPTRRRAFWNAGSLGVALLLVIGGVMSLAGTAGPYGWRLFAVMLAISVGWSLRETFSPARSPWRFPALTFAAFLATYLCIPPNCGVPKYRLDQKLTQPEPLDPDRLYLSVYPPPEHAYPVEEKPEPFGTTLRVGSTSMWGRVRLVNGYSPIRPAGVARLFDVAIHGELAPWAAEFFPEWKAGPGDELAQIGVDGIIVAAELDTVPQPATEWQLVHSSTEGRVYHRRGAPFPRIRSAHLVNPKDSASFGAAAIRVVEDSRNRAVAEVEVPSDGPPAHIAFSRPFFRGYRAHLDDRPLEVRSFRNLIPVIELPAGSRGVLMLEYRPGWLVAGGTIAVACMAFCLAAAVACTRRRGNSTREERRIAGDRGPRFAADEP